MRFDPAADPWGAAMLVAAVLWLLALLVVLAASLSRTSRRTGGYLMLVSLLAFLGAAVGGTWVQVQRTDALAAGPLPPAPEPLAANASPEQPEARDHEGSATPSVEDTTGDRSTDQATSADADDGGSTAGSEPASTASQGDTGADPVPGTTGQPIAASTDDGEPSPTDDTTGGAPEPAVPEPAVPEPAVPEPAVPEPAVPVVPEDLPHVDPLPTEASAREAAIRKILDEAARAAGGGQRCGNLKRVAEAWAQLQLVPVNRKAKSIAAELERCRRRLLYSISQKRLDEMTAARDAWFDKLPSKLRKQHGLIVQATVSGGSHERIRIGHRELDATRADAMMDAGLRDDLLRLEFAHVVLSNGKKSKTYVLPVIPEGELGLPWLRAVGLGEPLRLAGE